MLDKKDLEAIGALLDTRLQKTETDLRNEMHTVEGTLRDEMHTMEGTLRDEIQQAEQRMKWFTELKIKESEELLLEDADWTKSRLEAKIDAVDKKIEEIQEYYRIRKLNDDTTALLAKRIDRLEQKIAARS